MGLYPPILRVLQLMQRQVVKDFTQLKAVDFWKQVETDGEACKSRFISAWNKLDQTSSLLEEEANNILDDLFIYTHLRIKQNNEDLANYYPTKQYTRNQLVNKPHLWWVDHFTAGISVWSTLDWFSARKRSKPDGSTGYAGACTHFVQPYHGHPFYIIPLMHGSWNEPHRNSDSISIEMVNAGGLKLDKQNNKWHYWAKEMPDALIKELPPVILDRPYRGCTAMQPFTLDQITNNIKLKRLIFAAMPGRFELERMSQHSDWREGKSDMGPLWPFTDVNKASYSSELIPEIDFIQQYDHYLDAAGNSWEDKGTTTTVEDANPEYGFSSTPSDGSSVLSINDIQLRLNIKGYNLVVDGRLGPKTAEAIKSFQSRWNHVNPRQPQLKVDGIPGPKTCTALTAETGK
jgi:N-acetyl-anhydromuramyl-L-alanine amidase AmpD